MPHISRSAGLIDYLELCRALGVDASGVAADVGHMINPDTVEAQIQSSIVFGIGAGLMQEITMEKGRGQHTNYNNFPVVRSHAHPVTDLD